MLISVLFFAIALLYSIVGFGGGSSYIAILALFKYPYTQIPVLALICNIIVVSGGAVHYYKQKHFSWNLFWPFAVTSMPFALIGGRIPISKSLFLTLLGVALLMAGLHLFLRDRIDKNYRDIRRPKKLGALGLGATLGLLSGLVGIGGGIFLAPILLILKWGHPKQIAAVASFFILVNSIFGLIGQILKQENSMSISQNWLLFLAVFLGGQIGSRLGSGSLTSQKLIKDFTAVLVSFVGLRILLS